MADAIKSYRDLIAWQKTMLLCCRVYDATSLFPKTEVFGLAQQLRRAAVSVPSNIAEGWGRGISGDYGPFLRTARGSLAEVETQLTISRELGFLSTERAGELLSFSDECSRILQGLIWSVERN